MPISARRGWSATGVVTDNVAFAMRAAPGAGQSLYVTHAMIQNSHASVATTFTIRDGTTGRWVANHPAAQSLPNIVKFDPPLKLTSNTALNGICGTTGSNVIWNVQGYTQAD